MATRDLAKEAQWRREFAEWKKTGLSGAAYCRQRGIPYYQFKDWQKKLRRIDSAATHGSSAASERSKAKVTSANGTQATSSASVEFAAVNVIDSGRRVTRKRGSANAELMTREEAADYLGVNPQLLKKWHCTGNQKLPLIKVGRQVRYRRRDLDAFLQQGYSESKQEQRSREPVGRCPDASKESVSAEIVLPNGITVRLNGTNSLQLIAPLLKSLETC